MAKIKGARSAARSPAAAQSVLSLSHLCRETRTALELAVVALAPSELLERLASGAGLLEALIELPANSPPALALVPGLIERTKSSLEDRRTWQRENFGKEDATQLSRQPDSKQLTAAHGLAEGAIALEPLAVNDQCQHCGGKSPDNRPFAAQA